MVVWEVQKRGDFKICEVCQNGKFQNFRSQFTNHWINFWIEIQSMYFLKFQLNFTNIMFVNPPPVLFFFGITSFEYYQYHFHHLNSNIFAHRYVVTVHLLVISFKRLRFTFSDHSSINPNNTQSHTLDLESEQRSKFVSHHDEKSVRYHSSRPGGCHRRQQGSRWRKN